MAPLIASEVFAAADRACAEARRARAESRRLCDQLRWHRRRIDRTVSGCIDEAHRGQALVSTGRSGLCWSDPGDTLDGIVVLEPVPGGAA